MPNRDLPNRQGFPIQPQTLRLLAALLAIPEQDSLSLLQAHAQQAAWLQDAVAELGSVPLAHWQGEHTRLFLSGYPRTPCPPFESAFRHGQVAGGEGEQLMALYRQMGLEPKDVPPDYLGTLLECAAYLLEQPHIDNDTLGRTLWQEHLESWVPRFARTLITESELLLYRRLGEQLLQLFPKHEHQSVT